MNHDDIHDGIVIDGFKDCALCRAELAEELGDKRFGLGIIEDGLVIFFVEDELEGRVVDELLDFLD